MLCFETVSQCRLRSLYRQARLALNSQASSSSLPPQCWGHSYRCTLCQTSISLLRQRLSAEALLPDRLNPFTCSHLPRAGVTGAHHQSGFYKGPGELNVGPHTCVASTLPTKLSSPQYCSLCKGTCDIVDADMNQVHSHHFFTSLLEYLRSEHLGIVLRALCELFNLILSTTA